MEASAGPTVRAVLDERGSATYQVVRDVAWDHIAKPVSRGRGFTAPDALIYGMAETVRHYKIACA